VHRGQLLKRIVKNSDLSITTIAKRAGYSRATYYNHIEVKSLSLGILERYGNALGHDFSMEIPEISQIKSFTEREPLSIQEAIMQRDQWRSKYFELIEKYKTLLEEKVAKSSNK
jgi:hypothetical protein